MKRCIRKVKLVICKTNKQKDHLGEEIINDQVYYKLQPPPYVSQTCPVHLAKMSN